MCFEMNLFDLITIKPPQLLLNLSQNNDNDNDNDSNHDSINLYEKNIFEIQQIVKPRIKNKIPMYQIQWNCKIMHVIKSFVLNKLWLLRSVSYFWYFYKAEIKNINAKKNK